MMDALPFIILIFGLLITDYCITQRKIKQKLMDYQNLNPLTQAVKDYLLKHDWQSTEDNHKLVKGKKSACIYPTNVAFFLHGNTVKETSPVNVLEEVDYLLRYFIIT